jgi:hypothetical protein
MEPMVVVLDDFQRLALQKTVDDRNAAEQAYNTHNASLRKLVAKLMASHDMKQEDWPFVEFDRLSMGVLRFQPAPVKAPPPEKKDPAPPPAETPADPPPPPPGPRLLPAADGSLPEMEWKSGDSSDTPEALPPQ